MRETCIKSRILLCICVLRCFLLQSVSELSLFIRSADREAELSPLWACALTDERDGTERHKRYIPTFCTRSSSVNSCRCDVQDATHLEKRKRVNRVSDPKASSIPAQDRPCCGRDIGVHVFQLRHVGACRDSLLEVFLHFLDLHKLEPWCQNYK